MARLMRQKREIKELFREKIKAKIAREKMNLQQNIEEELPSWISWAVKPLASVAFDWQHYRDCEKGDTGESKAILGFWTLLPKEWVLINDVVLETAPEEFIQVDHLLIGPPGVFIIETKAWEGAFLGYKDKWKRKQGNKWVPCDSPTKQNSRHVKLFKKWLEEQKIISLGEQALFPVVLFTNAKWLGVEECSMPVFDSVIALSLYIRGKTKASLLKQEEIDRIAEAVINATPYESYYAESSGTKKELLDSQRVEIAAEMAAGFNSRNIQIGKTKEGRFFVKVVGSEEEAQRVWDHYRKEEKNPSTIRADKFTKNAWFFYFEE